MHECCPTVKAIISCINRLSTCTKARFPLQWRQKASIEVSKNDIQNKQGLCLEVLCIYYRLMFVGSIFQKMDDEE
jgi:hypothetical protein